MAFATVHRFASAVSKEGPEEDLPESEGSAIPAGNSGAAARAALHRNSVAFASLSLVLNSEQMVRLLINGQSEDWPSGLAWRVVEALHRQFKPDDIVSKIELRRMLNQISMTKKEDPSTLFEQLSKIENQFNTAIGKEDAIAIILDAAPAEYQSVLNAEQRAKGSNITLQDLADAMDQQWRSMYGKHTTRDLQGDDGNEIALGAINTFRGKCHNCGEEGHKAQECTKPKKTAGKGFKDKTNKRKRCNHCGKTGHTENNCWNKPENASKRPKWYKPPQGTQDQAFAAISCGDCGNDGDSIGELLCMGTTRPTFPNVLKLLQDPCVWIGDTGATRHMTRHNIGLKNQRKPNGSRATMGNGHVEKASVVGNIFGTVCDKHGDQLGPVSMMDVAVFPNLAYNMFSMTKMMRQGWILGSNKEAMWLSKGKNKLVFDIVIPMAEGCVFAIYMTRQRNEELANAATDRESAIKPITMQQAHDRLGHMSEQATKATASALKIPIKKGELKPCAACAAGKAKQKCIK